MNEIAPHGGPKMRRHVVAILALFLSISLLTTAALAANTPAPATDEASALRELAERLLAPVAGAPYGPQVTATLYAGKLPPGVSLPLPANARLVGSVARTATGANYYGPLAEIVLDVPGTAPEVLEALKASLGAAGWTTAPTQPGMPHGFQAVPQLVYATFCKEPSWLSANVGGKDGGPRDVRLSLSTGVGATPCQKMAMAPAPGKFPPGMEKLPALYAPKGTTLIITGMPSGPDRFGSEAVANTTTSARELEAHLATQLRGAGWTRAGGSADGPFAWSSWKVGADWTGLLFVLESSSGTRELSVRVISTQPILPSGAPPAAPPPGKPAP